MMVKNTVRSLALVVLVVALFLVVQTAVAVNGDFSLQLNMNGEDLTELETVVIDLEREIIIDIRIFSVTTDVTLEKISVAATFAGQTIFSRSESLGSFRIAAGEEYNEQITIYPGEALKLGGVPIVTGIYPAVVTLEYSTDDQQKAWVEPKNIKILGNPLRTPAGVAGVAISVFTAGAILMLIKSLIAPGLPVGAALPASTPISPLPRLYELAAERLEPTARGRLTGSIVKAAKKRIIKDRCPICETRLKHGYCYTCKKSAKEVRKEYVDRVRVLALQSRELLTSDQVVTLTDLCSRLEITDRLGTDVIASLKYAKLVKVRGIIGKLVGKAVMVGIGSGLSAVFWVTVGGLAALSSSALVVIMVASVVVPVTLAKGFQMKAKRTLKKHTD